MDIGAYQKASGLRGTMLSGSSNAVVFMNFGNSNSVTVWLNPTEFNPGH